MWWPVRARCADCPGNGSRRWAIHIASADGARFEGRLATIGTVEAGKQADLVAMRGDPSRRIGDVENVEIVFRDGYGCDPVKLRASVQGMVGIR